MKTSIIRICVQSVAFISLSAILSCATPPPTSPSLPPKSTSTPSRALIISLGGGDEIAIRVWENDDLTRNIIVDASGNIDFPLVGQIHVMGLSLEALKARLTQDLTKYLVDPKVEINVVSLASQSIQVLGEIEHPGAITLTKSLFPWEAISVAGGYTRDANQSRVLLIRIENGTPTTKALDLNTDRMAESGSFAEVDYLRNGDIVYVPRTTLGDVEAFANHFKTLLSPFISAEQAIVLWPQAVDALSGEIQRGDSVVIPTPTP